jgi:phthiodiolone/phenolphthiodiolone dimycocerosates ketoreductase
MEDLLRIIRLLLDSDGLIEHQGYHWRYQNAWIGSAVPHKPQIWILGGGPKLMELAARYADGYVSAIPCAYQSPEQFAEEVVRIRRIVEENGRDPEQFGFGLWYNLLLHDDDDLLERAINNPLVRWISAIAGRFDQADWQREGIEPLFPLDWQYSLRLLPAELSRAEADAIVAKSPRSVTEKSYICGNAKEVASVLRGYADAGATFHSILDMAPTVMSLAEAPASLQRSIDVCRALKA